MRIIRDEDVRHLESIHICLWEIRRNIQRGGRAGVNDIDDWAKQALEILDAIREELR